MTRLEKIRTMSAEELAEELYETNFDAFCNPTYCSMYTANGCELIDKPGVTISQIDAACKTACIKYLNSEIEPTDKE